MSDTIIYQYVAPSALIKAKGQDELFLAKYSEVRKKDASCFFWGRLSDPHTTARCLITLSNVVQSSYRSVTDFHGNRVHPKKLGLPGNGLLSVKGKAQDYWGLTAIPA